MLWEHIGRVFTSVPPRVVEASSHKDSIAIEGGLRHRRLVGCGLARAAGRCRARRERAMRTGWAMPALRYHHRQVHGVEGVMACGVHRSPRNEQELFSAESSS